MYEGDCHGHYQGVQYKDQKIFRGKVDSTDRRTDLKSEQHYKQELLGRCSFCLAGPVQMSQAAGVPY